LKGAFLFIIFWLVSRALAQDGNPFTDVRDRDQWAIEQVMEHKAPVDSWDGSSNEGGTHRGKRPAPIAPPTATPFQTKSYNFQTETDEAKVGASITDNGSNFTIDISCDQTIQGWLLKFQSTKQVFLKGGTPTDNPYKCRIAVDRPYIRDFGLTVYVTQDSDPAFIQLF
jgi:hypothetical protein